MAAKPAIEATAPLSAKESKALLASIGSQKLSDSRRTVLHGYSQAALRAYEKRSIRQK